MSIHSYKLDEEQEFVIYDQELGPAPELPVHPKVTTYAIPVLLFVFLLILKETGRIDWSWWWISLPLWLIPAGFVSLILLIILVTLWHEVRHILRTLKPKRGKSST